MRLFAERGRLETELWTKKEIRQGKIEAGQFILTRCLSHDLFDNQET